MATSNRDVKLTVEAQALGADSIKNLAAQVRSLGKEGTDAAPEFARLAAELDQIADQSAAINSLKQLEAEVSALAASQANAARIAEGTAAAYAEQKTRTDALRATLAESTTAWNLSRNAQAAARQVLDEYRATLIGATREEKAADTTLRDHTANSAKATGEVRRRKVALDEAATALRASTKEETAAGSAYRKTAAELTSTEVAVRKRTQALADAQGAASKLGVETTDLAAAEAQLRGTLTDVVSSAEANRKALVELAAATKDAADAAQVAARAQQALDGIRKVAYQQDAAAKVRDEAEATRALAASQAQAERAQTALNNIRRLAYQQDATAKIKAEAEATKVLTAAQAQAERVQTALNNIRRIAFQQDVAAKIEAEALAMRQLAAAADAAAKALPNAFNQAGVRSVAAIQAEITQTSQALVFLERSFKAGAISAYDLQRATGAAQARLQTLQVELTKMPAAVGVFNRMNTAVLDLANRFGALAAALATVGFVAKPILDANLALDSMRRVLTTVYGSAEEAGKQIEFVRRVAENAGLDVLQLGNAFTKFAASAKASGLDAALVQRVFEATAGAAGNLGLASDKAAHILDALGQMANKGTVSMEELRQQLGDSLPGALSLLAKGLGITEPQLVKLVESGKLLTTEALGPLADAMLSLAAPGGRVEGLRAAMERLGNQFTLAFQKISDTSFYRGLTTVVGGLADNFGALTTGVKLFAEALVVSKVATVVGNFLALRTATTSVAVATVEATTAVVGHTAATGANTVAATTNTAAKVANVAASTGASAAMVGLTTAVGTVGTAMAGAAASVSTLSRAKSTLGAAAGRLTTMLGGPVGAVVTLGLAVYELGPSLVRGAAALVGFGDKSDEVSSKLKSVEATIRAAAAAREAEGEGLVKAKVQYAEQADVLGKASLASEMLAKAIKDTGEASILAAELTGNERAKLLATSAARLADATALETISVAKRAEADLTAGLVALAERSIEGKGRLNASQQQELDLLLAKRDMLGPLIAAEQERTNALLVAQDAAAKSISSTVEQIKLDRIKLEGQRAATKEAEAAALKERALADAANFAAEAARNQTGRIRELEKAHRDGQESVDLMRAALARGETTQAAYNATVTRAGQAQGLYRIALDQAAKAGIDFKQIQTGVGDSFFETTKALHGTIDSLQDYKVSAAEASPVLEEAFDKQLAVAKTTRELEFLRAEVDRAQQAGLLFGATYSEQLDKIKQKAAELNPVMRQLQAEAKRLGVELAGVTGAKSSPSLTNPDGTQKGGNRPASGIGLGTEGFFASADRTRAEFLASQGGPVDNSYIFTLRDRLQRGEGFSKEERPAIENALRVAKENARLSTGSLVPSLEGSRDATMWVNVLQRVLESTGQSLTTNPSLGAPGDTGTFNGVRGESVFGSVQAAAKAPSSGGTRTIRLELGGMGSTNINVASDADAAKVEAFMAQLQTAMARAGG